VAVLDYFLNLSKNISALSKDKSICLPVYKSSLNFSSDKHSLINSGSTGASGY
jgi:hypothetical protein